MTDEQGHLECEIEELQLEIKENSKTIDNLRNLLEQNNEKLRNLKEMTDLQKLQNKNWDYKVMMDSVHYPQLEVVDENTIVVGGVKYQRVEPPKPPTLYDALCEKGGMYSSVCDTVCEIVKEWLPPEVIEDGEEYHNGWNDCLKLMRLNLK